MSGYLNLNVGVGSRQSQLPPRLVTNEKVIVNPTADECFAAGWREITVVDDPQPGWVVDAYGVTELSPSTCRLVVAAEHDPVAEAAQRKAEKLATMPLDIKYGYAPDQRKRLRAHFSDLTPPAEQNPTITEEYVAVYFKAKRDAGLITAEDDADVLLLQRDFDTLNAWWGTGNTWDFPWEVIA